MIRFVACITNRKWENLRGEKPSTGGPRKGEVCTVNGTRRLMLHFAEHPGWFAKRFFRPLSPSRLEIFHQTIAPEPTPGDIKRKQKA